VRPDPQAFGRDWVARWNAMDLEDILAHYAEDVVFTTPKSTRFTGDPTGRVVGKAALRDYWGKALATGPLRFDLLGVLSGPDGIAVRYFSSRTQAEVVEVCRFDAAGLVIESAAYYE